MSSKTCLVIDNDLGFASFVQRVAQGLGLTTQVLWDPMLLESALRAGVPDVITLDMDMPGRSGREVLKALAGRDLNQRVIVISGSAHSSIGDEPKVDGYKVTAVLSKPARKSEIEAALATALAPPRK